MKQAPSVARRAVVGMMAAAALTAPVALATAAPAQAATTSGTSCHWVYKVKPKPDVSGVNVRISPYLTAKVWDVMAQGETMYWRGTVYNSDGAWYKVGYSAPGTYDPANYYVHSSVAMRWSYEVCSYSPY